MTPSPVEAPHKIAALLRRLDPTYTPTPLLNLPRLAALAGVAQVRAKDESRRPLGSFKSLGGAYAAMRALAREADVELEQLLERGGASRHPPVICASEGNHGLAVAAGARIAGGFARVFLPHGVAAARLARIQAQGAEVVWVDGTYDDAVEAAHAQARAGGGVLVADTSVDPGDPAVRDVMAGYGVLAMEVRHVWAVERAEPATHLIVQAGVGGLAAALADGLHEVMAPPARVVVVEPSAAGCVAAALGRDRPVRVTGPLTTAAEMLACGEASAAALPGLRRCGARALALAEEDLAGARGRLAAAGGPASTRSGAAGVAGLMRLTEPALAREHTLDANSRVLLVVTEGDLETDRARSPELHFDTGRR